MEPSGRLVVIGAGDVGGEVARRWVAGGGEAMGFTASTARHEALARAGVQPRVGEAAETLRPDDRVLLSTSGSEPRCQRSSISEGPFRPATRVPATADSRTESPVKKGQGFHVRPYAPGYRSFARAVDRLPATPDSASGRSR